MSYAGFWNWRRTPDGKRERERKKLLAKIAEVFLESGRTYGSPRVYHELRRRDVSCSREHLARPRRSRMFTRSTTPRDTGGLQMRHAHLLAALFLLAGCAGDPAAPETATLTFTLQLDDAAGAGWPVTAVVVSAENGKTRHEVELTVGSTLAAGSIEDVEIGVWRIEARTLSERLLLAEGSTDHTAVAGRNAVTLDFVDWNDLFPELPRRILMIGHSHVLYNGGMDVHLAALANDLDARWNVEGAKVAFGGWNLQNHWLDPLRTALDAIDDVRRDVVALFGSIALLDDHGNYTTHVGLFSSYIRGEHADPWVLENWAPPGSEELQGEITSRVRYSAAAADAPVVPLGRVWAAARAAHPEIPLYSDAAGHPTHEATYLAACTLVAAIFGISPEGAAYVNDPAVSEAERDALQTVAWETVSGLF